MPCLKIGIIGVGNISKTYIDHLGKLDTVKVVACADINEARAHSVAKENSIQKSGSVKELLEDSEIDLILNLTAPKAHFEVAFAALNHGKHVYNEKPLSVERAEGEKLVNLAESNSLMLGCAPDTFLGSGLQTCRYLIDEGLIGYPIGFNAFMLSAGPESWHPAPEFFYKRGGGPLFDMGPYYLTAIVSLLGPISKVSAFARASYPVRSIKQGDLAGTEINVETPTHHVAALELKSGVLGQLQTSFDVHASNIPCIEIYGSEGTLSVPDPNTFDGPVSVRTREGSGWEDRALTYHPVINGRGLGIYDLANALEFGFGPRASGKLALHVLDAMHSILESAESGRALDLRLQVDQPSPMGKDPVKAPI